MTGQLLHVSSEEEWKAYHAIRRHVLFDLRGLSGYDENHPDEYVDHHFPLLFIVNGQPVGTARLDHNDSGKSGILRLVAVLPEHQRQGTGTAMIRAVEDLAIGRGIRLLIANAAHDAVIFYEKLGWSIVDASKSNPLMEKQLSPAHDRG